MCIQEQNGRSGRSARGRERLATRRCDSHILASKACRRKGEWYVSKAWRECSKHRKGGGTYSVSSLQPSERDEGAYKGVSLRGTGREGARQKEGRLV